MSTMGLGKKDAFTAVDMLSAPRPQAAIASPDGLKALSVVDRWNETNDK